MPTLEYYSNQGDLVLCDLCNEDYTNSDESGGFVFESKGVCPKCAPRVMEDIEKYGEQAFIKARCSEGQSHADFIREYRGGPAITKIYSFGPDEDPLNPDEAA